MKRLKADRSIFAIIILVLRDCMTRTIYSRGYKFYLMALGFVLWNCTYIKRTSVECAMKRLHDSIDSIKQIPKSQIKSWNIFAPGGSSGGHAPRADWRFVFIISSLILARSNIVSDCLFFIERHTFVFTKQNKNEMV